MSILDQIAAGGTPPVNPLDTLGKLQSLRTGQMQQQGLALENQTRQQAMNDSQALTKAYQQWDGKDYSDLAHLAVQNGATGTSAMAIQKHALDTRKLYSDMAKVDSETGKNNLETAMKQNDVVAGHIANLQNVPDEQLGQAVVQTAQQLSQARGYDGKPLLDPQHVQAAQQIAQMPAEQQRAALAMFQKDFMAQSQQMAAAKDARDAAADKAKLPGLQADSQIKMSEAAALDRGGMTQTMADMKYRTLQQQIAGGKAVSPDDKNFIKAYEKQKLLVPVASAQIRMEGMGKIRQFPVYDNTTKQTVYMDSNEINDAKVREPGRFVVPQYSPEAITQQQTGKTFAPGGKGGEEALAFQTAMQHADLLRQAAKALNNGDNRTLTGIKNKLATEFGDPDMTNFNAISHAYQDEVQKMIASGHMTDSELKKNAASLPDNANYATIDKVLSSYQALAQSKLSLRKKQEDLGKQGKSMTSASPATNTTNASHQVGDVVKIGNKNIKITAIHADGTFDGSPVQ